MLVPLLISRAVEARKTLEILETEGSREGFLRTVKELASFQDILVDRAKI